MIESAAEFERLRLSEDPAEYNRAAGEPASFEVWMDVVTNYPHLRFWVAQNKTVPLEMLELLADDPDFQVRRMVAMKRKLPAALLAHLADDSDAPVRASVARHRKTPDEVLRRLADDPVELVRREARKRFPSPHRPIEGEGSSR